MDISKPTIITINNRFYRCLHQNNFVRYNAKKTNLKPVIINEYDDEEDYIEDFIDTAFENFDSDNIPNKSVEIKNEVITKDENSERNNEKRNKKLKIDLVNNEYMTTIHIPNSCRGYIIGKNASTIKEITNKTKAQIQLPDSHSRDEPFFIIGKNKESVRNAFWFMEDLLNQKRKKEKRATHFLAIMCNNKEIISKYKLFKEQIIGRYLSHELSQAFINENKLHLTISVFTLFDNYERGKLVSFMRKNMLKTINEFLSKNPISKFTVQGLDYFSDDPTCINVLYAKVDEKSGFLQELCNQINTVVDELGYTISFKPNVKLHMTLLNVKYIEKKTKNNQSFDASNILKEFKDYYFGTATLEKIDLMIINSTDESNNSYKSTHSINIK